MKCDISFPGVSCQPVIAVMYCMNEIGERDMSMQHKVIGNTKKSFSFPDKELGVCLSLGVSETKERLQ